MPVRTSILMAVALAAGLSIAAPTTAATQQPVRVRKEAGGQVVRDTMAGDVMRARVDTITITRVDTITVDRIVTRVDTVTVTRVDTVFQEVQMRGMTFYWGLGGGGAIPGDNLESGFDAGWNATLLAGWRANFSPWGIRLDGTYNQLSGGVISGVEMDDASVSSAMLDATFDIPWAAQRTGLYLLGGVGVHHIGGFDIDDEDFQQNDPDEPEILMEETTDVGVNAGLGIRFPVGGSSLFLEGRWVNVFTETRDTRYFPIVIGLTF